MQRNVDLILMEMLDAIDGIEQASAGKSFEEFGRDWLLRHGVQRGLEIISEAARHLPDDLVETQPAVPWRQVKGIGSILRHEYHKISDRVIWSVVTDDLPVLRSAIEAMRERVR